MSSQERFVSCLREARELLRDPLVQQFLQVLHINPGDPFVDVLLKTSRPSQTRQEMPPPLHIPELGLEEVLDDECDSDDTSAISSYRPCAVVEPSFPTPTWDPVFMAECKILGALLRDGPVYGGYLFHIMNEFRSTSRHIPDRLDTFSDWISSRPRLFRCTKDWIVCAADGAEEFLSCKRDVMGFLAGCYGYKSTASAIQTAIPRLAEEV